MKKSLLGSRFIPPSNLHAHKAATSLLSFFFGEKAFRLNKRNFFRAHAFCLLMNSNTHDRLQFASSELSLQSLSPSEIDKDARIIEAFAAHSVVLTANPLLRDAQPV